MDDSEKGELANMLRNKLPECFKILNKRYKDCDYKGHINPVQFENICNHCYRRLDYSTSVDAQYADRKNMDPMDVPFDAAKIMEEREEEIRMQKHVDFCRGLVKIAEELNFK